MMDKLISRLLENGIYLSKENDKLSIEYNGDSIPNDLLEEIRNNKEKLLKFLAIESSYEIYKDIIALKNSDSFKLSSAQRRLWILSQLEGGSVAYNIPNSVHLHEEIDIECFRKAFDSVIGRHEILRTVFRADKEGDVKQWILKKEALDFNIIYKDFRKENNKEEIVKQYIAEDAFKEFNFVNGPLLRAGLFQLEEKEYIFYYNMHHIISDGWSLNILKKDVFEYYKAYKENKQPELKPLRVQYKDYSAWQLTQLEEAPNKLHKTYWLERLSGELPVLNLPSIKQRPRIKTNTGRGLNTYIDSETSANLKKYSEHNGGTLFMSLVAVWNVLMQLYTLQRDFIIGTPVAGRDHADLEDQIGFYINTLALRNEVNPEDSFNTLFLRVKQNTLAAYSHQIYPFDSIVEELNLVRNTSRSAVFDMMIALQNNGEKSAQPDPIAIELKKEELHQITDQGYSLSRFDMEIVFKPVGDYLSLHVTYNPDVYEKEMVEGLIRHFKQLLPVLLENQEQKISQIDYLSKEEKYELEITFNDTKTTYPSDKTIIDLFEEQVLKTPNNIALSFEKTQLTYQELHEHSNQLAHYLKESYKIKADDLVGIKLDRSEWMIISMLGVLKAGGAYVPIDPEYPQERIDYIEKDTKCKVCIDEKELNNFKENQARYANVRVTCHTQIDNLAYVMYTSGSTGRPKGVMIEHKSVVRLVKNTNFINVLPGDVILGLSNFSFDGSIFDIFMPLLNGGKLAISSKDILLNPQELDKTIADQGIDSFFLTTALFNSLVESELPSLAKLKYLLFGGEQVSVSHVNKFKNLYPGVHIHHVYGPTENTTYSTWYPIDRVQIGALTIPIGAGISNSVVYILDEFYKIVPKGVTGEIYVGGPGLARGYLNQEALTKEKFIKSPFKDGERLYKTGDLGRWIANGNIEFIGRKDGQVKIRGYRIELGEIEQILQSHKEIEAVVVLAREKQDNEKELIAYITAKEKQDTSELRSYLKERLPEYMLPTYFIQLEAMPLNANGKIDKKFLPDPDDVDLSSGVEYVPPRNELEEKLVKIWEKILQKENISVMDNFFELGGHSLKAMKLLTEYNKSFNVRLTLQNIYAKAQLSLHAELIDIRNWAKSEPNKETIKEENMETFSF